MAENVAYKNNTAENNPEKYFHYIIRKEGHAL